MSISVFSKSNCCIMLVYHFFHMWMVLYSCLYCSIGRNSAIHGKQYLQCGMIFPFLIDLDTISLEPGYFSVLREIGTSIVISSRKLSRCILNH